MADNGGGDDVLRARAPGAGAADEPSAEVRPRYGLRRRGAEQGRVLLPMHVVAHLSVLVPLAAHHLAAGPGQAACRRCARSCTEAPGTGAGGSSAGAHAVAHSGCWLLCGAAGAAAGRSLAVQAIAP